MLSPPAKNDLLVSEQDTILVFDGCSNMSSFAGKKPVSLQEHLYAFQ